MCPVPNYTSFKAVESYQGTTSQFKQTATGAWVQTEAPGYPNGLPEPTTETEAGHLDPSATGEACPRQPGLQATKPTTGDLTESLHLYLLPRHADL